MNDFVEYLNLWNSGQLMPGLAALRCKTNGNPTIRVAVLDSEINGEHPFLTHHQLPSTTKPADHGTHIASVIAGYSNIAGSVYSGIAPGSSLISLPVYQTDEHGVPLSCDQKSLAAAINQACDLGAHIINISGGELTRIPAMPGILADAVNRAYNENRLIIAATGNDGLEGIHTPACLPGVLAVGAADWDSRPLSFSNYGSHYKKNAVLAPGIQIPGAGVSELLTLKTGTSFATPVVSGIAALLLSRMADMGQPLNPMWIRELILNTSAPALPVEKIPIKRVLAGRINLEKLTSNFNAALIPLNLTNKSKDNIMIDPLITLPDNNVATSVTPAGDPAFGVNTNDVMAANNGSVQMNGTLQPAQPQAGVYPAQPQAGVYPAQPQAGVYPAQPQAGVYPAQPQAGVYPAQPQAGVYPAQPQAGFYPAQPQAGVYPAQPQIAVYPGQQYAISPSQQNAVIQPQMMPTQHPTTVVQPNSAITPRDSHSLIYCLGSIGFDFQIEARQDYFIQRLVDVKGSDTAGLDEKMFRYIVEEDEWDNAELLTWILKVDGTPTYAIKPVGSGKQDLYKLLVSCLYFQLNEEARPNIEETFITSAQREVLADLNIKIPDDKSKIDFANAKESSSKDSNIKKEIAIYKEQELILYKMSKYSTLVIDQVAVGGNIVGEVQLFNGSKVPLIEVSLSSLKPWNKSTIVNNVLNNAFDGGDLKEYIAQRYSTVSGNTEQKEALKGDISLQINRALEKIYHELKNNGVSEEERAINFVGTNIFQLAQIFNTVFELKEVNGKLLTKYEFDSYKIQKSKVQRPTSILMDVTLSFFELDKENKPMKCYRFTVDVSDINPVMVEGAPKEYFESHFRKN
ncbi:MAG: cyanobactin maturation PatA/PatG family protease [Alteromonadaceae bacterium]|jgi:cyanobactin maturation PatA/PatG family protease